MLRAIYESKNFVEVKRKIGLRSGGDNNVIKNILFEYNIKFTEKEKIKNIIYELELKEKNSIYISSKEKRFRSKNKVQQYCDCGKVISKNAKKCKSCSAKLQERKVKDRPKKEDLILMVSQTSLEAVGRKYGVSGNAVKKWLKN